MPEAVIDTLEMVQIDLDDRQRQGLLLALLRKGIRPFKQRPAIIQAGQRIVPGLPLKRVLQAYTYC